MTNGRRAFWTAFTTIVVIGACSATAILILTA